MFHCSLIDYHCEYLSWRMTHGYTGISEQVGENSVAHIETARMTSNDQLIYEPSATEILASVEFTDNGSDKFKQLSGGRQNESSGVAEERLLQVTLVGAQPFFLLLPFDILLEILSRTNHLGDLLAVARTCKNLCRKLTDPSAYPLWRGMRRNISLPDPAKYTGEVKGDDGTSMKIMGVRKFTHEPAYAAFVFDGGPCEICHKDTDRPYRSFSLRIRLCDNSECFQKIRTPGLLTWTFILNFTRSRRLFQSSRSMGSFVCNS